MTHYNVPVVHHIPINQVVKKYIPVYYPVPVEHKINIPVKVPVRVEQKVILDHLGLNTSSSALWSKNTNTSSYQSRSSAI